jgi:hypothetical protein
MTDSGASLPNLPGYSTRIVVTLRSYWCLYLRSSRSAKNLKSWTRIVSWPIICSFLIIAACIVLLEFDPSVQNANGYYPKKQTLHYMVGYKQEKGQDPILCAEERQAAIDTIKASRPANAMEVQAVCTASSLPQWIENDRKVLRFYGYFQEQVNEDPSANMRVRKVIFFYYLEDDTMQISEPRQDNSGLPQVCTHSDDISHPFVLACVPT